MKTAITALAAALAASATAMAASPAVPIDPAKPAIVLVHGAFADGSGWKQVSDSLSAKGFRVEIVQEPETSLDADVAATKRTLDLIDGPVVLVGHSWGGQVVTQAGTDPKVKSLVYLAALMPKPGESVAKLEGSMPPVNDSVKKTTDGYFYFDTEKFPAEFAGDVPVQQARFMAHSQVLLAVSAFEAPVTAAAWQDKPSFAVVPGDDHVINPALERWMYKRANAKVTEVPGSSHAVYVSHPDVVVKVIEQAVAAAR